VIVYETKLVHDGSHELSFCNAIVTVHVKSATYQTLIETHLIFGHVGIKLCATFVAHVAQKYDTAQVASMLTHSSKSSSYSLSIFQVLSQISCK
jgi:hypothetical protein